jgi:DNA-binding Lrp family transcriptional regulator
MRNDEGFAITTNNEIKNIIGMTKETVIHALNDLKQLGLITKTVASYGYRHRPHKISLCMDVINHLQVEGTAHV